MRKEEFLNELLEIMQIEINLNESTLLESLEEWDSMAKLAIISLFDLEFKITLTFEKLKDVKTISELMQIANEQIHD